MIWCPGVGDSLVEAASLPGRERAPRAWRPVINRFTRFTIQQLAAWPARPPKRPAGPDRTTVHDGVERLRSALPQVTCDQVYATSGYEESVTNLQQVSLTNDNVFGEDDGGSQLATVSGTVGGGYTATLQVPI
jgi:hypothetical protein